MSTARRCREMSITGRRPVDGRDRCNDHQDEDRAQHSQGPERDRTGDRTPQKTRLSRLPLTVRQGQQCSPQRQARAHLDTVGRRHRGGVHEHGREREEQARQRPPARQLRHRPCGQTDEQKGQEGGGDPHRVQAGRAVERQCCGADHPVERRVVRRRRRSDGDVAVGDRIHWRAVVRPGVVQILALPVRRLDQRARHGDELSSAVLGSLTRDPLASSHRGGPEGMVELVDAPEGGHGEDPGGLEQEDSHHDERGSTDGLSHSPTLDVPNRPDVFLGPTVRHIQSIGNQGVVRID